MEKYSRKMQFENRIIEKMFGANRKRLKFNKNRLYNSNETDNCANINEYTTLTLRTLKRNYMQITNEMTCKHNMTIKYYYSGIDPKALLDQKLT